MATTHTRLRRAARGALAVLATLSLGACGEDGVALDGRSGLLLTVKASQVTADQGRLHIEGPTNRTVTLRPGDTQDIDLEPGSYTVSLEGLAGGVVVGYWQRSATVTEGNQTALTVSLANFSASAPSAVNQANAGEPITVSWSSVGGAASYDLEASASTSFSPLLNQQSVTGTSAQVTVSSPGTVYFRVRPRTRFSGVGAFGAPSSGTLIRTPVAEVTVSPSPAQLEVDQTATFTAVTKGAGGEILSGRTVTWSSTNTTVATVDAASGLVTARAVGSTTIRATSEGVTGVSALEVLAPGVASVEVNPPAATIPLPGTVDLGATARSGSGSALPGKTVTWRSADETIATVDGNGRVTAVGGGVVAIIATVEGVEGSATITVDAGQPPAVNSYDVFFLPVSQGCGEGFRHFRTDESLTYVDNDGNMDPGRTFAEPIGGTPTGVQSQWMEEGAADWKPFGYSKGWTPAGGASGTSGGLSANGSTCWKLDTEPTYVDFRVRVRDANGNWSPWFAKRLMMPATVTVTPGDAGVVVLNLGQTQQFSATALDVNGLQVPGDPINWGAYVGSAHATLTSMGQYTPILASVGGLDWLGARAAYALGFAPIQAGFTAGSWFSPGWNAPGLSLARNTTRTYRIAVYSGREYTLTSAADGGGSSGGDLDLYIRFGQAPTLSTYDDRSFNSGLDESLTWTAPSDGILYVLLHAYGPNLGDPGVTGARFGVEGDFTPPSTNEALASPGAPTGPMRLLTDDEAARTGDGVGLFLPPGIGLPSRGAVSARVIGGGGS